MDNRPVGVFDSGMGGISLLRNLRALLPEEDFVYYGDDANAPYGTKTEGEILALSRADVDFLLRFDVKAIVIACNTATSAAAKTLRSEMTLPIIGIEPALKPAALARKGGKIAVLATPATLRQQKFTDLMRLYGEHALPLPCPGLMEFAERGVTEGDELDAYLENAFSSLRGVRLDGVVLGCTHYSFLCGAIRKALPNVPLFDGNDGTARQLKRVLTEKGLRSGEKQGSVSLYTSGDAGASIPIMQMLLSTPISL
ncbi:MAG: glutamate racemase [Clostridia bacterium]|nr:glutamate racemase [Clostridia bacterium]